MVEFFFFDEFFDRAEREVYIQNKELDQYLSTRTKQAGVIRQDHDNQPVKSAGSCVDLDQ